MATPFFLSNPSLGDGAYAVPGFFPGDFFGDVFGDGSTAVSGFVVIAEDFYVSSSCPAYVICVGLRLGHLGDYAGFSLGLKLGHFGDARRSVCPPF